MGLLESFLESLGKNAKDAKTLDNYRMQQTIRRGIGSSPLKKRKKKSAKSNTEEEFLAITGVAGLGAIDVREGASQDEIEAINKYMECIKKLQQKGRYSESEIRWLIAKANQYKEDIRDAREEYDKAGGYISDTIYKANKVIKDIKSPRYIIDKKKRKSLLKPAYYGVDDPFYDSLHEIYGEDGLEGYRKERLKEFENIPPKVVKLASQRYQRVNNMLTHVKSLVSIAGLVVFGFKLYPEMLAARWKSNSLCNWSYRANNYIAKVGRVRQKRPKF